MDRERLDHFNIHAQCYHLAHREKGRDGEINLTSIGEGRRELARPRRTEIEISKLT